MVEWTSASLDARGRENGGPERFQESLDYWEKRKEWWLRRRALCLGGIWGAGITVLYLGYLTFLQPLLWMGPLVVWLAMAIVLFRLVAFTNSHLSEVNELIHFYQELIQNG